MISAKVGYPNSITVWVGMEEGGFPPLDIYKKIKEKCIS